MFYEVLCPVKLRVGLLKWLRNVLQEHNADDLGDKESVSVVVFYI